MKKATAIAPSNIALIKYWGTRDAQRTLPYNPSISMTLDRCVSTCTVEPASRDEVLWCEEGTALEPPSAEFSEGVLRQVQRLRHRLGFEDAVRVATTNSFPTGAGLASSASGFAALTLAVVAASGASVSDETLSNLARESGSGSAARSVLGGFVEWPGDDGAPDSPARRLAPADHWDLYDLVAVVDSRSKEVSSKEGHRRAPTSPHFPRRLELLPERLRRVRRALLEHRFDALAEAVEEEAVELHLIAMSSTPPIFYWSPGTVRVLGAVREARAEGLVACATIDAGPNVHVLCPAVSREEMARRLKALPEVERLIEDRVGTGPRVVQEHLL